LRTHAVRYAASLSLPWLFHGLGPQELDDLLKLLTLAAPADKQRVEKIRRALLTIQEPMDAYKPNDEEAGHD